jgi:hypothetical protein
MSGLPWQWLKPHFATRRPETLKYTNHLNVCLRFIQLIDKMCKENGCKKRPAFNEEGSQKALYCSTHKKEGMINVISKTCIHEGCKKQPAFNEEGSQTALYCSTHKKE